MIDSRGSLLNNNHYILCSSSYLITLSDVLPSKAVYYVRWLYLNIRASVRPAAYTTNNKVLDSHRSHTNITAVTVETFSYDHNEIEKSRENKKSVSNEILRTIFNNIHTTMPIVAY